ncbi:MAG: HD-GYP domain-containing protein [bacterium]|nr:HD-GYP domain-containing protein [bacterium]
MHKPLDLHQVFAPTSVLSSVEWASVQTLLLALECRDAETYYHSLRVADLATKSCQTLGLTQKSLEEILIAALLHDIGKIGLPDSLLQKAGRLSKSERGLIAMHPELSANILAPLPMFDRVRDIILQHHERFDGTGYPEGRRGEEIIIESRVLAISDAFDALCTERPYRSPLTSEEAIGWIESEVGRQFCPVSFQAIHQVFETQPIIANRIEQRVQSGLDSISSHKFSPDLLMALLTNS